MTEAKRTKRASSGHKAATPKKSTATVNEMAQQFTVEVVAVLAATMRTSIDDHCRLAAATALLNRGHGRTLAEMPKPVVIPMGGTLTAGGRSVLAAVAGGAIGGNEGSRLIAAIGALAQVAEVDELASRIVALEVRHGNP